MLVRDFIEEFGSSIPIVLRGRLVDGERKPLLGFDKNNMERTTDRAELKLKYPEFLECEIWYWDIDINVPCVYLNVNHITPISMLRECMEDCLNYSDMSMIRETVDNFFTHADLEEISNGTI